MAKTAATETKAGDVIEIVSHQVGGAHRKGEILEVLGERGHEHYRVRWEDETETIFYPSTDAHVVHRT